MISFQTIGEANEYFEQELDILLQEYEEKQQTTEKNEKKIRATLIKQYEQQLSALELQQQKEETMLKRNHADAVEKIKLLFENKRKNAVENYKNKFDEEIRNFEVNKIEMLEQKQAEERAKFKLYSDGQKLLMANSESVTKLNIAFELAMDELQQGLLDLLEKYSQLFDGLEQQLEENCIVLEQLREEVIENLINNEEASQNQLDNQLFEALQQLDKKREGQLREIEESYSDKEQSLEEMVHMQYERNNMEYEQQRERLFELQEQVLAQFDK